MHFLRGMKALVVPIHRSILTTAFILGLLLTCHAPAQAGINLSNLDPGMTVGTVTIVIFCAMLLSDRLRRE
jgi:hypothetical protein